MFPWKTATIFRNFTLSNSVSECERILRLESAQRAGKCTSRVVSAVYCCWSERLTGLQRKYTTAACGKYRKLMKTTENNQNLIENHQKIQKQQQSCGK